MSNQFVMSKNYKTLKTNIKKFKALSVNIYPKNLKFFAQVWLLTTTSFDFWK